MNKHQLDELLPGPANVSAKELYRTLEIHFTTGKCEGCKCYRKYGVMLLSCDASDHVCDLVDMSYERAGRLLKTLQKAKLIEIEQFEPRQHRIVFVYLLPKKERKHIAQESKA